MSIIFDIKRYTVGKNKYEDYGYAVFPLFSILQNDEDLSIEHYVNSGIYQVTLQYYNLKPINSCQFTRVLSALIL
jgi:hypothetical protein